eukprot:2094517-Rhodomonas_salina.1
MSDSRHGLTVQCARSSKKQTSSTDSHRCQCLFRVPTTGLFHADMRHCDAVTGRARQTLALSSAERRRTLMKKMPTCQ